MLMFFLFTIVSLHVVLIIPGCMSMFKVGKGSPGVLNSITPQKLLPLNPPSPSEFPMIFHGGGMDIFWNHTFNKNSSLKFCELERYIPAAQTQSKPQRVIVLVCRLQKSSTGDNNFVKWGGHFSSTDQNDKTSQSGPPSKLSPEYSSQTKLKWSVPFDEPTKINSGILG